MIHLGCSGWNYRDWIGKLYPPGTRDMLKEYSKKFGTVEINTTFYRVPPAEYVENWIRKSSNRSGFTFSLKFPREITHELLLRDISSAKAKALEFENRIIRRIQRRNALGCVLLQLPPYFTASSLPYLFRLLEVLDTGSIRYFVEVREKQLYDDKELVKALSEMNTGFVDIDSPEKTFGGISSLTDAAYIRFHGRNASSWNGANKDPSERYRYLYSNSELEFFSSILKGKAELYRDIFIYFNNHPGGFAPSNASTFREMIGMPPERGDYQKTLF